MFEFDAEFEPPVGDILSIIQAICLKNYIKLFILFHFPK